MVDVKAIAAQFKSALSHTASRHRICQLWLSGTEVPRYVRSTRIGDIGKSEGEGIGFVVRNSPFAELDVLDDVLNRCCEHLRRCKADEADESESRTGRLVSATSLSSRT
jgi:hypothetical protein